MEMSSIRYFLAVCKERNFTRAARRCGVAQPSLTRGIRLLEEELGGRLFHRRFDGAALTALGMEVEPHFAAIARSLAAVERARRPLPTIEPPPTVEPLPTQPWTSPHP